MMGFYGVINGKVCTRAIDFVIEARNPNGEKVPKEALAEIMNKLSDYDLENNLFTKKEIKLLRNLEDYDKTKMYSLKRKEVEYDEDDEWDEEDDLE